MAPRVLTMAMASMAEDEKKADGKARRAHPSRAVAGGYRQKEICGRDPSCIRSIMVEKPQVLQVLPPPSQRRMSIIGIEHSNQPRVLHTRRRRRVALGLL